MTQWLKYCASNQKVRGSNPSLAIFILILKILNKENLKIQKKILLA